MQIVIDIPNSTFTDLKKKRNRTEVDVAVLNGTPLPKGHGRLIDENEVLKMTKSYKSELGRLKADPFVKSGIEQVENFIRDLSPIIDADKESE